MFRKLALALAVAGAVSIPLTSSADAAVGQMAAGAGKSFTSVLPVEKAQFVWGGYNYCWYAGGWHGPGWYWCGYPWRTGLGWGGGYGWHGWGGYWHGGHWHWRGGYWHGGHWYGHWRR